MAKEAEATETKEVAKLSEIDTLKKELQAYKDEYRALKTENNELKSIHAPQYAEMKLQLEMAKQLISSKAFPNYTPEQAFVILQAGKEMDLQPMQSIKSLYCVNGQIGFWGAGLVGRLVNHGCEMEYLDETDSGVTVKITYKGKTYTETVSDKDPVIAGKKAMTIAKKNKMRFHGVRMIANFYLAHLVGSVSVWEPEDYEIGKELAKGEDFNKVLSLIDQSKSQLELNEIFEANKNTITKSLELTMAIGKKKKEFI